MTKRAVVTKRAGSASNLVRFVTLVTKRAVVTKRAAATSIVNAVRFDENPFTCQTKRLRVSNFALLLVVFK